MTDSAGLTRIQVLGIALGLAVCAALFLQSVLSPRNAFVWDRAGAPWIQAPEAVTAIAEDPRRAPVAFVRETFLAVPPGQTTLVVRALGEPSVRVNGVAVAPEAELGPRSKEPRRYALGDRLVQGPNRLEIDVRRERGVALLSTETEPAIPGLSTAETWRVRGRSGALETAVPASDVRPYPDAETGPTTREALSRRSLQLGVIFLGCTALAALALRVAQRRPIPVERLALGFVALFWLAVFVRKGRMIPPLVGFDAQGHLHYVEWLLTKGTLPLATDGWCLYHPPLFYLFPAAAVIFVGGINPTSWAFPLVKLYVFLGGVGTVLATAWLARELFDDPRERAFATLIAGLVPMNVYLATYFSNEPWAGFTIVLALLATVRLLRNPAPDLRDHVRLGVLYAVALLVKFTAVVAIPIFAAFVALRAFLARRDVARASFVPAAVALALSGWFFVRNWLRLGSPMPANWGELPTPDLEWWQHPSFHTPAYFTHFGESLVRPFFSGFRSFWDALHSTFWGDGYAAGRAFVRDLPPIWGYDWMLLTYLIGVPLAVIFAVGFALAVRRSLRGPDLGRRLGLSCVLTLAVVLVAALATVSVRYPYYGQAKAFYVLPILPAVALSGGVALSALDRALARMGSPWPRALALGALGTCAVCVVLTYAV